MKKVFAILVLVLWIVGAFAQPAGFTRGGVPLPFVTTVNNDHALQFDRGGGLSPANMSWTALQAQMSTNVMRGATNAASGKNLDHALHKIFNVRDYGARGDGGTTLNDAAFQAAINDAQTNGGTVFIPEGQYAFACTQADNAYLAEGHMSVLNIRSNRVVLKGSGMDLVRLYLSACPTAPAGDGNWNWFGSLGVTNVTLEGFTLDGGGFAGMLDLTQFYNGYDLVFRNVRFQNCMYGDGVDTQNGGTVTVEGCEFFNIEGNCLSTQDALFIARNCRGKGTGYGLEFRARDSVQSPASVIQSYATQTRISGCVFENFGVALDQYGGTVHIEDSYFYPTNVSAITNFWVGGGTLKMDSVTVFSAANFTTGHLIAVNTNGALHLTGCTLDGKRQIQATKPLSGGIAIRSTLFGTVTLNNNHAISLSDGTGAIIANCTFLGNGYRGVSVDGPLPFHNVRVEGGHFNAMSVLVDTSASTNFFCDGAYFQTAGVGFWAGSGHTFQNNTMVGSGFPLNMGGAQNTLVENNQLDSISIFSSQPVVYRNNRIANPTISGTVGQINASRWEGNTTIAGIPLRSTTLTANYTADAVDSILIFNGSNLTNTIPSAVALNNRKVFTIKNLHSTALEVTNATGAQTFDGALRFSLPQYASRVIVSDGANWQTVSSHTP
jgi:hypothetical protein